MIIPTIGKLVIHTCPWIGSTFLRMTQTESGRWEQFGPEVSFYERYVIVNDKDIGIIVDCPADLDPQLVICMFHSDIVLIHIGMLEDFEQEEKMTVKPWNLYLDDERKCPYESEEWVVARSSAEALELVAQRGFPALMSLDHDLGGEDTSMRFLRALIETWNEETPIPEYQVHSANPVGARNIVSLMESWKKSSSL